MTAPLKLVCLLMLNFTLFASVASGARAENATVPSWRAERPAQARWVDVGDLQLELGTLDVARLFGTSDDVWQHYVDASGAIVRSLERVPVNVSVARMPELDESHLGGSRVEIGLGRTRVPVLTHAELAMVGLGALGIIAQLGRDPELGRQSAERSRFDLVIVPGGAVARGRF